MKTLAIWIVLGPAAFFALPVNAAIDILAPPPAISTNVDHVYIVGRTDLPSVNVYLNDQLISEVITKDSIFHSYIKFGYGLNEIKITPLGDSAGEIINILSGPSISRKYEGYFEKNRFHGPTPRSECTECHQCRCEDPITIDNDAFCLECHKEIDASFDSHIPNTTSACITCHHLSRDLAKQAAPENADSDNPCYSCHKDKIAQFSQDYVHGPVAGGSCEICHDPHGSEFEKNLLYPIEVLCSICHGIVDDAKDRTIQHPPFAEGKCSRCHDPHATNNRWVLKSNSKEICSPCHMKNGKMEFHNHPYNVKPKNALSIPLELTDDGLLECLSCHNPHASDTEHLLRTSGEDSCIGCHPDR